MNVSGPYVYKLFDSEVSEKLAEDPELALIFYANFQPYDMDIDPMHNPDWVKGTAVKLERDALKKASDRLSQARAWLKANQKAT